MVTIDSLADQLDLDFEEEMMVKGVEFAKFTDEDDEVRYHLIYPDGHLDPMSLSEVYSRGNYTLARTRQGDMEVMVDDDGVHEHWDE